MDEIMENKPMSYLLCIAADLQCASCIVSCMNGDGWRGK